MRKYLPFLLLIVFYVGACKKSTTPQVTPRNSSPLKIASYSGEFQTAHVGEYLRDSMVVRITRDNKPVANIKVEFRASGCNAEFPVIASTDKDGKAKYRWQMVGQAGEQKLTAAILDNGKRVDSVAIKGNAFTNSSYPVLASCTPPQDYPMDIRQLSTGRLIACFSGNNAIRYSDDEGITWLPLKSFSSEYFVTALVTTPTDEIFAATEKNGLFYSKDAGASWINVTPPTYNKKALPLDIVYTKSGKLILTGAGVFISPDKGVTWLTARTGLPDNQGFYFPIELNNGDFYLVDFSLSLFKSTDGGLNWIQQPKENYLQAICVDSNGWMYKSIYKQGQPGTNIYISKDNGNTFSDYTTVNDLVVGMKTDDVGNIYYYNSVGETYRYFAQYNFKQAFGYQATVPIVSQLGLISQRNWYLRTSSFYLLYFSGHNIARTSYQ